CTWRPATTKGWCPISRNGSSPITPSSLQIIPWIPVISLMVGSWWIVNLALNPRCLRTMKLILAIIQPSKLEAVKEALNKVEVFRLTIVDVQGFGRQKGHSEIYRGHELTVNLLRKVQLQIAVNEDFVEPTVNAIMEAGRTG